MFHEGWSGRRLISIGLTRKARQSILPKLDHPMRKHLRTPISVAVPVRSASGLSGGLLLFA